MSRKNNNDRHANLTEPPTSRKVAVITGGSARLGATIVKSLHSNGYDIGLHYLHSEKDAHLLVTQLNEQRPGSAFALRQDLAEDDAATKIREHFLKKRGRMDLLVNNASIFKKTQTEFPSPSEWERIFSLTQAKDRTTLINLRDSYRNGIPLTFGNQEIEETKKIFKILAKFGGRDLVGSKNELSQGTFWLINKE